MKTLLILLTLLAAAGSVHAQTFAEQVKALQSAPNWPAIEQALKTQRDDLMEANQAAIADAVKVFRAERDAAKTEADAAKVKQAEAAKAIAQRDEILKAVTVDDKKAIADAIRTEKQRRKDEAQAKLDAAKKELEEASK